MTLSKLSGIDFAIPASDDRVTDAQTLSSLQESLCIVMTFRDTSADRRENLLCVLRWYAMHFPLVELLVVEQDTSPHLSSMQLPPGVQWAFACNPGLFNRAWGFNVGAAMTRRDLLLFSDGDVLLTPQALRHASKASKTFDVVKPYREYLSIGEEQAAHIRCDPHCAFTAWLGDEILNMLCGGSILLTRRAFAAVGGWPEEFEGWGGEDNAMEIKLSMLATTVRLDYRGYHLFHARTKIDSSAHDHYQLNLGHLKGISRYSANEMKAYINGCRSRIGNPRRYVDRAPHDLRTWLKSARNRSLRR